MAKKNNQNWKSFEKLAYEYVSFLYKDYLINKQMQTDDSHDSGYDGIWIILPKDQSAYQKVLMEAKYRNSQTSLPLHDCAKAIIIAHNLDASKLYIATNIAFAPQTKEQIAQYNKRSDLAIICINSSNLKTFIQEKKNYLINECKLEKKFLEDIENSAQQALKNMIETDSFQKVSEEYLQDNCRIELISDLSNGLKALNTCFMLTGNEGVGKSILLNSVKEDLYKSNYDVCNIDLSLCTSSRVLYLQILEAVWGVTLIPVLEDKKLCSYIDQLIAIQGQTLDASVSNAVKHVLAATYFEYEDYKDNYLYLLLRYLDAILNIKRHKLRLVILFENLHMASEEILDFMLLLIDYLKKNGIRILLEVRTPFLLNDHHETQKSNFYYQQMKQHSDRHFSLEIIDNHIAALFIQKNLPFSLHVCEHLAGFLGDNCLEIQSALKVLKYQTLLSGKELDNLNDQELEEYWYHCGLSVNFVVLSLITKLRKSTLFVSLFEAAHLLRGEIPFPVLEKIYGDKASQYIQEALDSTLFKINGTKLICKHLRYLAALQKTSQPYECVRMAALLLPIIQENRDIISHYPYIELDLLYILNKKEDIPSCSLYVIYLLMDSRQYKKAIESAIKYIDFVKSDASPFLEDPSLLLQIVLAALQCMRELHLENEEKYEYLFPLAEKYIFLNSSDVKESQYWYKYSLLRWHKEFVAGKFNEAFKISETLFKELHQAGRLFEQNEDYAGQVYNAHGLSLKMIKGGNIAERFFEEGIKQYPESYYAKAAFLSQEGNRLLKTAPTEAYKKYLKLLETVKGKAYPFQEVLHTRIDVAMSSFLAGNFEAAMVWAKESADIASSVGIYVQKGRSLNILGCCKAANGFYAEAIEILRESFSLLSLAGAMIYVWRAQLNLAGVLLAAGNKEEAILTLSKVADILLTHFMDKIRVDNMSVPYQSLLLILMYLQEENCKEKIRHILDQTKATVIEKDFRQLSGCDNWKEAFHNKVICYNDIVLVTG